MVKMAKAAVNILDVVQEIKRHSSYIAYNPCTYYATRQHPMLERNVQLRRIF
jgi:hypothetical protein